VQFASLGAGENGGRFTVKKYHSEKTVTANGWRHDHAVRQEGVSAALGKPVQIPASLPAVSDCSNPRKTADLAE